MIRVVFASRFTIPTRLFLQIHDSRRLLITWTWSFSHTCILLSFSQSLVIHDSKIRDSYMFCNYDSWFRNHTRFRYKTRQDDLLNSALIRPGFLFNKNWIPDFNHYLDSTTRLRSGGNCKGDLAAWSRKKTTGRMSLPLSISAGFRIPKPWILGDRQ